MTEQEFAKEYARRFRATIAYVRKRFPAIMQQDAEDVAQFSWMQTWATRATFRGECSIYSWVRTIAHNRALVLLRSHHEVGMDHSSLETIDSREHSDPEFRRIDARLDRRKVLACLEPMYRAALIIRYVHDYSEVEGARVTGVCRATFKTRIDRGRRIARVKLGI